MKISSSPVCKLSSLSFQTSAKTWAYATENKDAIDRHWDDALKTRPHFFNGVIYLMDGIAIDGATARASFIKVDFKSYLYWRETGWQEAGVLDGFGTGVVRASDGGILLARQSLGHVNSGRVYLPGGFIDQRDVRDDGSIDLDASVARELLEETGLGPDVLTREPGFYLTDSRPQMSFAACYRANLNSDDLKLRVEAFLSAQSDQELSEIFVVHSKADIAGLDALPYAQALVTALFDGL